MTERLSELVNRHPIPNIQIYFNYVPGMQVQS